MAQEGAVVRRDKAIGGTLSGRAGSASGAVKFTRFEAGAGATMEIVLGDVVCVLAAISTGSIGGDYRRGAQGMIASGVVVYVSAQPVDFRKGAASLLALVRDSGLGPFSGALYVFRSKRADRVRIVWWDGSGVRLYSKILEENSFCWPGLEEDPTCADQTAFADGVRLPLG